MGRTYPKKGSASASQPVTAAEFEKFEENEPNNYNNDEYEYSKKDSKKSERHSHSPIKSEPNEKNMVSKSADSESKDADLDIGMTIMASMTTEDITELLERINLQSPKLDKIRVKVRQGRINWEKVAFSNYGPKECRAVWEFMAGNARKFRIMSEVVNEFRESLKSGSKFLSSFNNCPVQPKIAKGGFQYYIRQLWDAHVKDSAARNKVPDNWCHFQKTAYATYTDMTPGERRHYEKLAGKVNEEYQKQVQEYYNRFPGIRRDDKPTKKRRSSVKRPLRKPLPSTVNSFPDAPLAPNQPLTYFIQSKMQKIDPPPTEDEQGALKLKFAEKYKKLSNKKKAKWIDYTINYCENYIQELEAYQAANPTFVPKELHIKYLIRKSDVVIWEQFRNKPHWPHASVFSFFFADFCTKEENSNATPDEQKRLAVEAFKNLDWYHREMYKMNFKMNSMQYKRDLVDYFENVPNVAKPLVLDTIPRRHRPAVVDVGKYPGGGDATDDENAGDPDIDDMDEEPLKKKKNKKRRHGEESAALPGPSHTNQSDPLGGDIESEGLASDTSISKKKKKKRKRGDNDYLNSQSLLSPDEEDSQDTRELLITGDIIDNDPDIKIEDSYNLGSPEMPNLRSSPRRVIRNLRSDSPDKASLSKFNVKPKPPASQFTPDKVAQKDIDEAVRGIFDGRAYLGRKFSVYYYYAKYVASHKLWIEYTDIFGVLDTADRIIKTFIELNDQQKDVFIAQSYNFYLQKRYGIKFEGNEKVYVPDDELDYFPGEPRQPPRSAARLYAKEVEYLKRKNIDIDFPVWKDLHPDTQMVFIKKLYRQAQLYMKEYEEFVMNMSPNDLVEYTVHRSKSWAYNFLNDQTAGKSSVKGFIFPLPRNEAEGYESEPEMLDPQGSIMSGCRIYNKFKKRLNMNPFFDNLPLSDDESSKIAEIREAKKRIGVPAGIGDADVDSSDDEMTKPERVSARHKTSMKHLNEIKDFFHPLGVLKAKGQLKTRAKRVSKVAKERMRKASLALIACRMKTKKSKEKASKLLKPKPIKGKAESKQKGGRKPPVVRLKRKNVNTAKTTMDNSEHTEKEEESAVDETVNVDEDVDCSEFMRSLQGSPQKRLAPSSAQRETSEFADNAPHPDEEKLYDSGFQYPGQTDITAEELLHMGDGMIMENFEGIVVQETENVGELFYAPVFDVTEL